MGLRSEGWSGHHVIRLSGAVFGGLVGERVHVG
jgi:hypothetical protein